MHLVLATNCIVVFFCCLLALATFESSSNEAFITLRRTMTDPALQTRINDLAKQLSDLKTGIVPSITQQAELVKKVTELGSEVAAVRATVASDHLNRHIHTPLDQPQSEILANFHLAATLPDVSELSVEWLDETDMVTSPATVHPVRYFESQPGSQIRSCLSTTPDRQIGRIPSYYHISSDVLTRARALKDKSIARDLERSIPLADMLERLITGYEMLVRAKDLSKGYRRHALSYMRFGQRILHLEYMRQDHLMLLTEDPSNKRALQFTASTVSAGSGIADRFLTKDVADAYKKAGLSTPASSRSNRSEKDSYTKNSDKPQNSGKRHKDAESQ